MKIDQSVEIALQIITAIGVATAWSYKRRVTYVRTKIKADFEILKMSREFLGEDHDSSRRIEDKLNRSIKGLYRKNSEPRREPKGLDITIGILCAAGAFFFARQAILSENVIYLMVLYSAGAVIAGFISLGGFLNAFSKMRF